MKRIRALNVSIYTVGGAFALAMVSACGSGTVTPTGGAGGGTTGTGTTTTSAGDTSTSTSAGSATTSASGTGGGSSTPSICDNNVHEITVDNGFVDDFETDTVFPGWYSFADTDAANFKKIAREGLGAVGTTMAGHVSATGIKAPTAMGFGAGFGFGMKDAAMACAGVKAFDGVSFWAKGTSSTDNALRFQVVVAATQAVKDGGDCVTNCYNHPGKSLTLTPEWKQFTVKWTDLAGAVKVNGVILGLNWITTGPDFDVWIDEVTLFAGTAPAGPIGK
jgi:hypothetical protein